MHRATLSTSSTDDIMTTGMSRSFASARSASRVSYPFISGISMSSSTRSAPWLRSASSACRPFSAKATRWPSCSRVRATSSRFTRLSSTTSRLPRSPLRSRLTLDPAQRARDAVAFDGQAVHPGAGAVDAPGLRQRFEIPGQTGQGHRADAGGVGLERLRRASERGGVALAERAAHRADELLCVLHERREQLVEEAGPHRRAEALERRAVQHLARWPLAVRLVNNTTGRAALQGGHELLDANRLAHVIVHAGRQTQIAVA